MPPKVASRIGAAGGPLKRALEFVTTSGPGHPTVETLAKHAYVSRSQLYRLFYQRLAITPARLIRQTRLTSAARQLLETTEPVKAVASAAGFSSVSHFVRAFRAVYGVTPTQFRTNNSRDRLERLSDQHLCKDAGRHS